MIIIKILAIFAIITTCILILRLFILATYDISDYLDRKNNAFNKTKDIPTYTLKSIIEKRGKIESEKMEVETLRRMQEKIKNKDFLFKLFRATDAWCSLVNAGYGTTSLVNIIERLKNNSTSQRGDILNLNKDIATISCEIRTLENKVDALQQLIEDTLEDL